MAENGTYFEAQTPVQSSIYYRRLITGWKSSTFGISFIFRKKKKKSFWDSSSLAPHNNSVTFTCYLRRLSSLKQSKKSFSKFSRLWHHHPRARLPFTMFISRAVYLWPKQFQTGQNHMVIPRSQLPSHTHTHAHTRHGQSHNKSRIIH